MARYTSAYSSFVARLEEVSVLRQSAAKKEFKDAIGCRKEINALCRGSIVLLSSHLEAFIKELGELALESMHVKGVPRDNVSLKLYYHISKNFLDELQNMSDPDSKVKKVFEFIDNDLSYWSKTGPFPKPIPADRFNKGFSNPKFDKIKAYLTALVIFRISKTLQES